VPTSVTSFAHRQNRADSRASFTYLRDEGEEAVLLSDEDAIEDEGDDERYEENSVDLEAGELVPMRRTSSGFSSSIHDRLLRSDSARTDGSGTGREPRTNQKIYIVNEDLIIVIAGFRTSTIGYAIYTTLCICTFGIAYLLFRWLPRWHVNLIGYPSSLRECAWVVIEVGIHLSGDLYSGMLISSEPMGRVHS
jgi:cation-transporting P-type ATPase 13A2